MAAVELERDALGKVGGDRLQQPDVVLGQWSGGARKYTPSVSASIGTAPSAVRRSTMVVTTCRPSVVTRSAAAKSLKWPLEKAR